MLATGIILWPPWQIRNYCFAAIEALSRGGDFIVSGRDSRRSTGKAVLGLEINDSLEMLPLAIYCFEPILARLL